MKRNRKFQAAPLFFLLMAVCLLAPLKAGAQQEKIIQKLNFFDTDLSVALITVADICGWDIEVAQSVTGKVSLSRSNILCQDALKALLDYGNLRMKMSGATIQILSGPVASDADRMILDMYKPIYVDAATLQDTVSRFLSPGGKIDLFKSTTGNLDTLILEDFPENISKVFGFLELLDVRPRQVAIGIKMIEVNMTGANSMGVNWTTGASFSGSPIEFDSVLAAGGRIRFGTLSMSQFNAVLKYIQSNSDAHVLQDATSTTMDGGNAHIEVTDIIPVGLLNVDVSGGGGAVGTSSVQDYNIGAILDVTPRITVTDEVDITVNLEISSLKSFQPIGGGSSAPVRGNRTAETNVLLKDNHTLVIGGLIQETDSIDRNRFPVLSDLPLVGNMFKSKNVSKNKSDLLIFITAHILEEADEKPSEKREGLIGREP